MARRAFFSFHYQADVQRAMVVRNSWVTQERTSAGFFDSSVFEASQKESDDALKRFLREGLQNTSVTVVLAGKQTFERRWVRYELVQSFRRGSGILCAQIDQIKNLAQETTPRGENPLNSLAYKVVGDTIQFWEKAGGVWKQYQDAGSMNTSDCVYAVEGGDYKQFTCLFKTYDYVAGDGYANMGNWIEAAAVAAGK